MRPLAGLLGGGSPHAGRYAAWIDDRALLCHRMWSPASMAALAAAREAVADARWDPATLGDAALVLATSRGAAAGWLEPWPGRRPFRTFAVSNSIHCEPATAMTIELGIRGPNHVVSSGCAAGLDAIGIAMMLLATGQAEKALVVAVDLPLVSPLLDAYAASGLLSNRDYCDPFGPDPDGLILGEAAAAIAIDASADEPSGPAALICHSTNSDAANPLATPPAGGRVLELMERAAAKHGMPTVICPHATGTRAQSVAETSLMKRVFSGWNPHVCLLKPWLGHTLGASGLIETVILAAFLRSGRLPPPPPGVAMPWGSSGLRKTARPGGETVCKLAHSIGGHNSLLYLKSIS